LENTLSFTDEKIVTTSSAMEVLIFNSVLFGLVQYQVFIVD